MSDEQSQAPKSERAFIHMYFHQRAHGRSGVRRTASLTRENHETRLSQTGQIDERESDGTGHEFAVIIMRCAMVVPSCIVHKVARSPDTRCVSRSAGFGYVCLRMAGLARRVR